MATTAIGHQYGGGGILPGGGMPQGFGPGPVFPVVGRILAETGNAKSIRIAADCMDSSALTNVCMVSLKSVPYAFFGGNAVVKEFDNGLSCRMRYMEVIVTSTASLVYNVVFGAIFTVLSIVTFAQVKFLCNQMRKNWVHAGLAGAAAGISAVGTVSPEWGIKANGLALLGGGAALVQLMSSDVIQKFCTAYQNHTVELTQALLEHVNNNEDVYNQQYAPLIQYLNNNLNDQVQAPADLVRVLQGAGEHVQNAFPFLAGIMGMLQMLAPLLAPGRGVPLTQLQPGH